MRRYKDMVYWKVFKHNGSFDEQFKVIGYDKANGLSKYEPYSKCDSVYVFCAFNNPFPWWGYRLVTESSKKEIENSGYKYEGEIHNIRLLRKKKLEKLKNKNKK